MNTSNKNTLPSTQNLNLAAAISHSFQEETLEAKARWFQSLTLTERMEMLCMFTDMILNNNPRIMEQKNVKLVTGRIRVLSQYFIFADRLVCHSWISNNPQRKQSTKLHPTAQSPLKT